MDAINRTGETFLSHTRLNGRFTIRVAIANLRTEDSDLELVWADHPPRGGRADSFPRL